MAIGNVCPNCRNRTLVPWGVVLFGPLWPFGSWTCESCHRPLRFNLFSYYFAMLMGLSVVLATAGLLTLAGLERGNYVVLIVGVIGLFWMPAALGRVEVGRA
jgi:hypothetical protein